MSFNYFKIQLLLYFGMANCQSQHTTTMQDQNNPLLCNPETGICEMPNYTDSATNTKEIKAIDNPIKVIYFTDPICSSCWGIEPQLRKLKLEYGKNLTIDYRMGGLLPDWSYNSGGISKPSDVAHHWDEVSRYYDMPIDGDLWLEDPLSSSFPPSIAFKAAQMQDEEKAIVFLRLIREMVFLQKKNITKWDYIKLAAENAGLNVAQLKIDFDDQAKNLFYADLKLARELGVRGFPTMIFVNAAGVPETVYGFKPYTSYEEVINKLEPTILKNNYDKSAKAVFAKYPSLTVKEFSELTNTPRNQSEEILNKLSSVGKVQKSTTKNGSIWRRTNTDL